MDKIKVGIIGASGYAGAELFRILLQHPYVNITGLSSISFNNMDISVLYRNFLDISSIIFENEDTVIDKADVIFTAVPHSTAEPIAKKCIDKNKICIDLGADFRLENENDYHNWYDTNYTEPDLHSKAAYGLPELFRNEIKGKPIIGNPGCYPTASTLALAPILQKIDSIHSVIIDAKSGTTGAGRAPTETTHFPNVNENFAPYKIAQHRHTPEIEQSLSKIAKHPILTTFVPHLLPINRGILATIYVALPNKLSATEIHDWYTTFYANEQFVRILPLGSIANIKNVKYSNYCDISIHLDSRTNQLILVSSIDNMVKGAAGQAIQNMNILFNLPENTALGMVPPAF